MEIDEPHRAAVERLCELLPIVKVNWALTGSVSHRIQGADVTCGDVDVQANREGAYDIGRRLERYMVQPVSLWESDLMRSHFGRANFADLGVEIEIMGAVQKRNSDGNWSDPTDPADHHRIATVGQLQVPVMSLDYEACAYEAIGREDRAALLRRLK